MGFGPRRDWDLLAVCDARSPARPPVVARVNGEELQGGPLLLPEDLREGGRRHTLE